jgi:hypothetical protein
LHSVTQKKSGKPDALGGKQKGANGQKSFGGKAETARGHTAMTPGNKNPAVNFEQDSSNYFRTVGRDFFFNVRKTNILIPLARDETERSSQTLRTLQACFQSCGATYLDWSEI